jgi:DNA-binding transcriptional LysR family regulator
MDFRLGQLRSFLVLAETLNYAKASRRLYMTQPTLTVQIKSLEESFQVRLFDRSRQGVTITSAGKELIAVARGVLDQVDRASERMKQADASRPVRICCSQAGQYSVLPALIRSITEHHPDIRMEFQPMVPGERLEALRMHRVDLLMMTLPMHAEDVHFELLGSEPLIAVLPDREPYSSMSTISVAEFVREPLLTVSEKECLRCTQTALSALAQHGVIPARLVEAPIDQNSQLAIVAGGKAVTMAGHSSLQLRFPGVIRLPFREAVQGAQLGMAWRNEEVSQSLHIVMKELRRVTAPQRETMIPIRRTELFPNRISA